MKKKLEEQFEKLNIVIQGIIIVALIIFLIWTGWSEAGSTFIAVFTGKKNFFEASFDPQTRYGFNCLVSILVIVPLGLITYGIKVLLFGRDD